MQHARIFNIQKFSVNDGPGIRTTVFFKGCPLRCKWCANPESQLTSVQLLWDEEKCCRCGTCVRTCDCRAISFEDGQVRLHPERCRHCSACLSACPTKALTEEGRMVTTDEVLEECLKDQPFYEESGGGVTLSGGEALLWPDFCVELLEKLHAHDIHTAIETTGYASAETFRRVAAHLDYLLMDMKHYDRAKHIEGTRIGNNHILANMQWAIENGKEVLVRIPVIPGFNDAPEDVPGFAAALKKVGAQRVQLLPFHQFGEKKYQYLTRDYDYTGVANLHPEDLSDMVDALRLEGIDAFL